MFERLMAPLRSGPALQRVPSGYWKVVTLADGRISAFVFDQTVGRGMNYCDGRTSLDHVVLRSRLRLFPMADAATFRSLDAEVGCTTTIPAPLPPATIPPE